MSDKPACPACCSTDTVSYWAIKANQPENQTGSVMQSVTAMYKVYYADARQCVDCDYVWQPSRQERLDAVRRFVLGDEA